MKVAIIPARGGSKRIPRKNIREFAGRPMMAWPITAALESALFDQVIVSTDDEEIAEVASRCGAVVPFRRPDALADDHTATGAVINHAIEWLNAAGMPPEHVCCLYATAPFVTAEWLRKGWERLRDSGKEFAFSVASFPFPIQRAIRLLPGGGVAPFQPECVPVRSQDLEPAFHDAGQFYWGQAAAFLAGKPMFAEHAEALLLPRWMVQDIDTEEDWERAERLFKAR